MAGNLYDPLPSQLDDPSAPLTAPLSQEASNPQPAQVPGEDLYSPLPNVNIPSAAPDSPEAKREEGRQTLGAGQLFSRGFQRGMQSARAIPESAQAIYHDLAGDEQAAVAAAQRAKAIEDEAPESVWELQNVRGLTDFGLWLTERLGENAVNLLAASVTGGAGGLVGALGARGLALSAAGRAAMIRAGAGAGAFGSSMPFETSGTMLEQFAATGSPQAETSLLAGTAKGLLELPTLFRVFAPFSAGSKGASSFAKELGKTVTTEAATELAQEEIDILARKYNDPSYAYFGGPALWRRAEAGVAGGAIGGIIGAPSAALDVRRGAQEPEVDDSGQQPGQRELVQEAGVRVRGVTQDVIPQATAEPEEETDASGTPRPVQKELTPEEKEAAFDATSREVEAERRRSQFKVVPPSEETWTVYRGTTSREQEAFGYIPTTGSEAKYEGGVFVTPDPETAVSYAAKNARPIEYDKEGSLTTGQDSAVVQFKLTRPLAEDFKSYDPQKHAGWRLGNYEAIIMDRSAITEETRFVGPAQIAKFEKNAKPYNPGPVTEVRNMVQKPPIEEMDWHQSSQAGPKEDVMGVSPMLRAGMPQVSIDEMLDTLEADTPRYALLIDEQGNYGDRLLTDTDLELLTSVGFAQSEKPKVIEVDQRHLQPAAITADVFDLPPVDSNRIWFLPGTRPETQVELRALYLRFSDTFAKAQVMRMAGLRSYIDAKRSMEEAYNRMVTMGLRVVPSRGSSFYYNGRISGGAKEVRTSARPVQAHVFLDLETGSLVSNHWLDLNPSSAWPNTSLPVTIDLNKYKDGEVSELPNVGQHITAESIARLPWSFAPGVSEQQKVTLKARMNNLIWEQKVRWQTWHEEGVDNFRRLMREGIYIKPMPFHQRLVLKEKMELSKMVPTARPGDFGQDASSAGEVKVLMNHVAFLHPETKIYNLVQDPTALPVYGVKEEVDYRRAREMTAWLHKFLPTVEKVLKELGITGGVRFEVRPQLSDDPGVLGALWPKDSIISLHVRNEAFVPGELFNTVMHEVGHLVTLYYYQRMPYEQQKQLLYAYNKSLQARRMIGRESDARFSGLETPESTVSYVNYFTSYVEWLAEQFRRWAGNTDTVTTALDGELRRVAQGLEHYYKSWEEISGGHRKDFTEPDYFFSAVMQYLRNFSVEKEQIHQKIRQQTLYVFEQDLLDSPVMSAITGAVMNAVESMKNIVPPGVELRINRRLDSFYAPVSEGAVARHIWSTHSNLNLIELAVGALPARKAYTESRVMISHELVHAYRRMGLMTDSDFESLYRFAKKDGIDLTVSEKASLREDAEMFLFDRNLPREKVDIDRVYESWLKEEVVAYYIGEYANTGFATEQAKTMLDLFLNILERIKQFVMGAGFRTKQDLLEAFFRGEMLERGQRKMQEVAIAERTANIKSQQYKTALFDKVEKIGNNFVATEYNGKKATGPLRAMYYWFEADPRLGKVPPVGMLQAVNRMPKGFDIEWIESDRFFLTTPMIQYMERDLGVKAMPSGTFTEAGFKFMQMRYKELAKYYVRNPDNGDYYSPNAIEKALRVYRTELGIFLKRLDQAKTLEDKAWYQGMVDATQKELNKYSKMLRKVKRDIWGDNRHLLDQMFMVPRNFERDEVQGSMIREGAKVEEAKLMKILGEDQHHPETDSFTAQTEQKGKLESERGIPPQVEVRNMRKIVERVTGLETSEETKKYLKQSAITHEADRIGWFTRIYWGLHQLVWRNPHVPGLLDYMQFTELFNQVISRWHGRADEVARAWDQKNVKRKEIGDYLFWAMEMKYLSPQEEAAKVVRHPTRFEREAQMRKLGLSPDDRALVAQIEKEFRDFLNEVEQVSIDNIRATVKDPVAASAAVMEVQAEMNKLRAKPYFPITRFGRYTVTVRDGANTKIVNHFEAFDTFQERDAAVEALSKQYPGDEITVGKVPEEMFEFMGLPAPLIRQIRENMPSLTANQQAWLEDFERINLPDRSFRKRWKPALGTPGHSMDGFRVYAHYFMHGSRYLARLKYGRHMSNAIGITRNSVDILPNGTKRRMIVDYMTKHYNYIMEGAKDWSKFKAFVSLWQLGFSPAAAMMNFTQTPVVSWPFLAGTFGTAKGTEAITNAMGALTKSKLQNPGGTGSFFAAWTEMEQQGRIDIGQAAELGSYAQGPNLMGLLAGTKRQKFYRNVSYYGMWMFQKAEEINRKIMFKAAWELAMKNPNTKRLQEIKGTAATSGPGMGYSREIADLRSRLLFTMDEAVAFIFAKEAIDQTQGIYAPYSRPAFMRKPLASTVLIFYQFLQMMSYVYRYNPGTMQLVLISLALYGMLGLPGAEDLNELVRFAAQKLFGQDWDPKMEARKYVRDITKGTVFDEVGPDLFLHGISRYGFGLGLLPEGWALGKFDASANGSLGKLVPGVYESLHGANVKNKPDQYVSDLMQRLSGAGFGFTFNFLQWAMENPGSVDSKKWESMLPRSARSIVKAGRMYSDEAETTRSGARIVPFDVQDPEDLAALGFQAIGFASTKVNATWELMREQRDLLQLYQAERAQLYGQMARAIQSKDDAAIAAVKDAMKEYNDGVKEVDPSMQIQPSQVMQSMRNREKARLMQEQLLPNQRSQVPVARRLQELFPNVQAERVRVQAPRMPNSQ